MKKIQWMMAAILTCGLLMASCGSDSNDSTSPRKDAEKEAAENLTIQRIQFTYKASTTAMASMEEIASEILVRYVDADQTIKVEPFTGTFSKDMDVQVKDGNVELGLELLLVPKGKEELRALNKSYSFSKLIDLETKLTLFFPSKTLSYTPMQNGPIVAGINFTDDENFDTRYASLKNVADKFGGIVPACWAIRFINSEESTSVIPEDFGSSFWKNHAYVKE